ncbi:YhjD/YihY/BrkB family envelope integrity protein [Natronosalvus caseinilyticus]|uniref:YhjD/YihY/BrkB family envelope integrity protein n=1 Tax=Natronosalvus caseinilyticus TaxID=2953747 RepID=UPI0028AB82C1|nr:YhjD/YihY/BrkB family envelope integrity protein [Natronosalvus caseinilyticus]
MALDVRRRISTGKDVVAGIQQKNVTFMAASIAYQAFISLIPLLVLVFFLVSIAGDEQLAEQVAATTEGVLPESGQMLLEEAIAGSAESTGASIIGLVTLVWGSLKIFRGLDTAFSEIYESAAENSFFEQLRDAFVVFAAIGLALLAAVVATAVFAYLPDSPLLGIANPLMLVVGFTLAFLPMYYFFPDVDVGVREILPGVVVAAVGWAALQALFQVYVALSSSTDSAGAIGAILLLLTWLYFGGLVLLVGAVVNATTAGRLTLEDDGENDLDRAPARQVTRERELEQLEQQRDRLARERDQLRSTLRAQRSRRSDLETRVDRLAATVDRLERENEELRRELERREEPPWRQALIAALRRVETLKVGTVRRSRDS